jgi:hypothetical protein
MRMLSAAGGSGACCVALVILAPHISQLGSRGSLRYVQRGHGICSFADEWAESDMMDEGTVVERSASSSSGLVIPQSLHVVAPGADDHRD